MRRGHDEVDDEVGAAHQLARHDLEPNLLPATGAGRPHGSVAVQGAGDPERMGVVQAPVALHDARLRTPESGGCLRRGRRSSERDDREVDVPSHVAVKGLHRPIVGAIRSFPHLDQRTDRCQR